MGRRDSNDYEPHRGVLILVLGLLGLLMFAPLGIVAWIMGNGDLRAMDEGHMDPEGRSLTQAGKMLGIVATILMILGFVIAVVAILFMVVFVGAAASAH